MGSWQRDPDHGSWERYERDGPADWPPETEPCSCAANGCVPVRHPVTVSDDNPDAEPVRVLRYEVLHARPIPAPKAERPEKRDHRRLAAGDR